MDVEVVCDLFDPSSKIIKLFRENNPVWRQFGTLANKNKGIVIIINWKKLWSYLQRYRFKRNIHNKTLTLKWNQYKESIPRFCPMLSLFCSEKFDLVKNTIITRITKKSFWDLSSIRNFSIHPAHFSNNNFCCNAQFYSFLNLCIIYWLDLFMAQRNNLFFYILKEVIKAEKIIKILAHRN